MSLDNAKHLLKIQYGHVQPHDPHPMAAARHYIVAPTPDLIAALEAGAVEAGVPAGSIDWVTFIPLLVAAISTGNWLGLIPLLIQLGPTAWSFIQKIIAFFRHPTPSPGPVVTGG